MTRHDDHTLPILDELGREFRALVRSELEADQVREAPRQRRRRVRVPRATRRRIARRTVVVFALLCLVGSAALAARSVVGGSDRPHDTKPAALGTASGAQLSVYRHEGQLCVAVLIAGASTSECGVAPDAVAVRMTSATTATRRYLVGIAGVRVQRVRVRVGRHRIDRPTHAPVDPVAAHAAGAPEGLRWFVASVPLHAAKGMPATATPLDAHGHEIGRTRLDCSLDASSAACRALARATARDATR